MVDEIILAIILNLLYILNILVEFIRPPVSGCREFRPAVIDLISEPLFLYHLIGVNY